MRNSLLATAAAALALLGALGAVGARSGGAVPEGAGQETRNVSVVGRSDLGGQGLNGDIAVSGTVALIGAGLVPNTGYHTERYNPLGCYSVSAKVVDVSNPRTPRVVATIPMPQGSAAMDVDLARVQTPAFTGLLAAIAIDDGPSQAGPTGCAAAAGHNPPFFQERGIALYDLNTPASPRFLGRYQADADSAPATAPPCGPPPAGDRQRCATGQHSVDLVQRADGRVLSISTEPAGLVQTLPSGDVRIVDVTDPARPTQVGFFPPLDARPHHFSPNGCAPFTNAHDAVFYAGGNRALVPYMDAGTFVLDTTNPAAPGRVAQLAYPPTRSVEGNAAYAATATVGGRLLALVSQDDWWKPDTRVTFTGPASVAGEKFACEGTPTVFDPDENAQLYRRPGAQVAGDVVYVGRGCAAGATQPADPYLGDPSGRIAFIDSAKVAATQPAIPASGANCRFDVRIQRAQAAGATAVIYGRVQSRPFAASPYAIAWGGMPTGLTIPGVMIDEPDADALRTALCPAVVGGACSGGQAVGATVVDREGEWGGLEVIDITTPSAPIRRAVHRTATAGRFPPPDLGVYSPGEAAVAGSFAYVAWHSDGLRVLDLRQRTPTEVAHFVPADTADPSGTLPGKASVVGVALTGRHVLVVDQHSGLYVLSVRRPRASRQVGTARADVLTGTPGPDRIFGLEGNDRIRGLGGNDSLDGGPGRDRILGEAGRDFLTGGSGGDRLGGGSGNDRLLGGLDDDSLSGGSGRDILLGGAGADALVGGGGNDTLVGGPAPNRYAAGAGNDVVNSANGRRETVNCGAGRDTARPDRFDRLVGCERRVFAP